MLLFSNGKFSILLLLFGILASERSISQNTLIDQNFASSGKLMPRFDKTSISTTNVQTDHKDRLVFATELKYPNGDSYVEVQRFNTAGQLDNTFDGDGKLIINLSNSIIDYEYTNSIGFTSDNKICILHFTDETSNIIKLNENGSYDNGFGTNGRLMIQSSFGDFNANLVVSTDNKLVVVGELRNENFEIQNIKIIRYNSNGVNDDAFGTAGVLLINTELLSSNYDYIQGVTVHPNGKITIFGESENNELLAVQVLNTGILNMQFAGDGQLVYAQPNNNDLLVFFSFSLDQNGRIIFSGNDSFSILMVGCLTENGFFDNSFGNNGIKQFVTSNDLRFNFSANPSNTGNIWMGGWVKNQSRYQYSLGKLNANGSINSNFGNSGYLSYPVSAQDAIGYAAYEQSDGKVLLIGFAHNSTGYVAMSCLRLLTSGVIDNSFGISGIVSLLQVQQTINEDTYLDATKLNDMKILGDDGIIQTGTYFGGGILNNNGIYLSKNLPNGNPDPAFGNNGFISISPMFGERSNDHSSGKVIVVPNKILTANPVVDIFSGNTILFTQHTTTGQFDLSFGDNGRKLFSPSSNPFEEFHIQALEFLPNGKIAMLIQFLNENNEVDRTEVVQLLANGNLDNSFSDDGKYSLPFVASHLKFSPDNRIVLLGVQLTPSFTERLAVIRLTTGGIADISFNNGSPVIIGYSSENDVPAGLIIEANNAIIIGFDPFNSDKEFGIVKLNANGTPFASWGTNGVLVGDLPNFTRGWRCFTQQQNGGYLLIGNKSFDEEVLQVLKLSDIGIVDESYGTNGVGIITFSNAQEFKIKTVGLQQNGKLLIAGNEEIFDSNTFTSRDYASIVRISVETGTGPLIYTMIQPGNWSNAANWQAGQVPPATITSSIEVIINPGGNGITVLDMQVTVQQGGKITVRPGKTFRVQANLNIPAININ